MFLLIPHALKKNRTIHPILNVVASGEFPPLIDIFDVWTELFSRWLTSQFRLNNDLNVHRM